jgi:hypothetical protein
MSLQMMYGEIKALRGQILELLKRIESLEDSREEAQKRRPVLSLKPELKASNVKN